MGQVRIGWFFALFMCLFAISLATRVPVHGQGGTIVSANSSQWLTRDLRINRYITNVSSTELANPTVSTTFDTNVTFAANTEALSAGSGFHLMASGNVTNGALTTLGMVLHVTNTERITATIIMPTVVTNVSWGCKAWGTVRTAGTSGKWVGQIDFWANTSTNGVTTTYGGAGTTQELNIDTTVANQVALGAFFGTSNAANKIVARQLVVETLR